MAVASAIRARAAPQVAAWTAIASNQRTAVSAPYRAAVAATAGLEVRVDR